MCFVIWVSAAECKCEPVRATRLVTHVPLKAKASNGPETLGLDLKLHVLMEPLTAVCFGGERLLHCSGAKDRTRLERRHHSSLSFVSVFPLISEQQKGHQILTPHPDMDFQKMFRLLHFATFDLWLDMWPPGPNTCKLEVGPSRSAKTSSPC